MFGVRAGQVLGQCGEPDGYTNNTGVATVAGHQPRAQYAHFGQFAARHIAHVGQCFAVVFFCLFHLWHCWRTIVGRCFAKQVCCAISDGDEQVRNIFGVVLITNIKNFYL